MKDSQSIAHCTMENVYVLRRFAAAKYSRDFIINVLIGYLSVAMTVLSENNRQEIIDALEELL